MQTNQYLSLCSLPESIPLPLPTVGNITAISEGDTALQCSLVAAGEALTPTEDALINQQFY